MPAPGDARAARLALCLLALTTAVRLAGQVLAVRLVGGLALVVDVLHTTSWDTGELRRSDQSRRLGYRSQLEEPRFILQRAASELVYAPGDPRLRPFAPPEPYARDPEALAAARDRLLASPGRLIGFVGDVDHDTADRLARTLVEALPDPNAPAPSAPAWLPLRTDLPETAVETMRNINQVQFAWFSTGLAWSDDRLAAWRIADHVLARHFYARLYVALRHEGGETYGARTSKAPGNEPAAYALTTFTRADNLATTEEKLRGVLTTFHADGITEQELADAVGFFQGRQLFELEAPGQALGNALWEMRNGLEPGFDEAQVQAAAALDVETVNAFIQRFYDPARYTMLRVEPKP